MSETVELNSNKGVMWEITPDNLNKGVDLDLTTDLNSLYSQRARATHDQSIAAQLGSSCESLWAFCGKSQAIVAPLRPNNALYLMRPCSPKRASRIYSNWLPHVG